MALLPFVWVKYTRMDDATLKKGEGCMVPKHVDFAPASQKQLGSRLRSPLLRRGTVPAQPFSRFFHHTAFAKRGNPTELGGEGIALKI